MMSSHETIQSFLFSLDDLSLISGGLLVLVTRYPITLLMPSSIRLR